jgi:hypothetical protein
LIVFFLEIVVGSYIIIIAVRAGMIFGVLWVFASAWLLGHPGTMALREGALIGLIFGLLFALISKPVSVVTDCQDSDPEESVMHTMALFGMRLERRLKNSVLTFRSGAPGMRDTRVVVRIGRGHVSMIGPRRTVTKLAASLAG